MKNRILSTVLAVLLVVSMFTVFTVSSSAEATGVTVTIGTTYAAPGTTALVPLYVSAETLSADFVQLRNFQLVFSGASLGGNDEHVFNVSGGAAFPFTNAANNEVGCSTDVGFNFGTAAQLTAVGGYEVAQLAFQVPADATGVIELTGTLSVLAGEDAAMTAISIANGATVTSGKIIVDETPVAKNEAVAGAGEAFVVPTTNASGKVTAITKVQSGRVQVAAYTGSFESFTIPAQIASIADGAITASITKALILKNTQYTAADAAALSTLMSSGENYLATMYYHKRANGTDTTYAELTAVMPTIEEDPDYGYYYANILAAPTVTLEGSTLTVVGTIAVDDLDYSNVTVTVKVGDRTFTTGAKGYVGTSVAGVTCEGGVYYYALQITGIPAGAYEVTATMYGSTVDAIGTDIAVVSDVTTTTVTVA